MKSTALQMSWGWTNWEECDGRGM